MTAAQVRKAQLEHAYAPNAPAWRRWELDIERLFRANRRRWLFFHLPRLKTKRNNQRLPRGWPDYFAVGRPGSDRAGRILVIEAKTGRGTTSDIQKAWVAALLLVPGVRGGVYYPSMREELRIEIGDDYVG